MRFSRLSTNGPDGDRERSEARGQAPKTKPEVICNVPVIGLAAVGVAAWAAMVDSDSDRLWADCILGWMLFALAWIDWRHMRLPDVLTLPLIVMGLAATALITPELAAESVVGAILGYAVFKGLAVAYSFLRGHEGLGCGDAKLLAAAGAWVGWATLPDVVGLAALLALGGVAVSRVSGRAIGGATAVPFGPSLAFAIWIVRLQGPLLFWIVT